MNNNRVILALFANFILWIFISELNNLMAPIGIHLHLEVLYVIFAGLYLRMIHGAIFTACIGLFANASLPITYGNLMLIFLLTWAIVVWARIRIRRENPSHVRTLAWALQTIWFIGFTFFLTPHLLGEFRFIYGLTIDFALSSFFLFIVAFPWCEFQRNLMLSVGWDLNSETNRV